MARRLAVDKLALFRHLGYEPHEGQRKVHQSPAPRRVLACGTRWGKSTCTAYEAVAAALQPAKKSVGWIEAPNYSLSERCFREVISIAAEHLRHRIVKMRDHEQYLLDRSRGY